MTTDESSASSHPSDDMTSTDVTPVTRGSSMAFSSASRGVEFYINCALIVSGFLGTVANALILYALVASKQHKKHVLIFNQNVLDLFSSVFTVVTYSIKLCNIYLAGTIGYYVCALILSEGIIVSGWVASVINLAAVTVERYLKVVHSVWSKKKLRKWMTYSTVAFAWLAGVIYNMPVAFSTTAVIDGVCYGYAFWKNQTSMLVYVICDFAFLYVAILAIFIFCYWRMLIVIRRQASVMAGHSAQGSSTGQTLTEIQAHVVKTMILVSAFYAISWLPSYVFVLLGNLNPNPTLQNNGYYACLLLVNVYTCTNPFIYATKFDPVRRILLDKFLCKQITQQQDAGNT